MLYQISPWLAFTPFRDVTSLTFSRFWQVDQPTNGISLGIPIHGLPRGIGQ